MNRSELNFEDMFQFPYSEGGKRRRLPPKVRLDDGKTTLVGFADTRTSKEYATVAKWFATYTYNST